MAEILSGDIECRKTCKFVLYLQGKADKAEEQHRNKCDAYTKLLYKNADLRQQNTSLREENEKLLRKLKAAEKNAEDVSRYKSRIEELEKKVHDQEVDIRKYERQ